MPRALTRTLLARLSRAGILPRDVPELEALTACLVDARMISADLAVGAAPGVLIEMLLRGLVARQRHGRLADGTGCSVWPTRCAIV